MTFMLWSKNTMPAICAVLMKSATDVPVPVGLPAPKPVPAMLSWGYTGADEDFVLALAGSSKHVLGEQPKDAFAHSHSLTGPITTWLQDYFNTGTSDRPVWMSGKPLSDYDVANAVWLAVTQMRGETRRFEFLARVLCRTRWAEGFRESPA
jgi:hypothetical protein